MNITKQAAARARSCCERRVGQVVEQPGERRPHADLVVEAHETVPVVEQDDLPLSAVVTFGGEDLSREPSHVREPGHVAPTSPGSAMTDVDATPSRERSCLAYRR